MYCGERLGSVDVMVMVQVEPVAHLVTPFCTDVTLFVLFILQLKLLFQFLIVPPPCCVKLLEIEDAPPDITVGDTGVNVTPPTVLDEVPQPW